MRARRAVQRLIEAYQEELISLDELRARSPDLRKRQTALQAELDALDSELHDAENYLKLTETLESFRQRLGANTEQLTIEQRQQIVRLLVREVLVGDDQITIRHSIPAPNGHQPSSSSLRSGGQRPPRQEGPRQRSEPPLGLGRHEAGAQQAGLHQLTEPLRVRHVGLAPGRHRSRLCWVRALVGGRTIVLWSEFV